MTLLSSVKTFLMARAPRERWLLLIFGGLLALWALWQFLVAPLLGAGEAARADLMKAQNDYRMMQQARPVLAQNIGTSGQSSERQAFNRQAFVDLARMRDIGLTRVQPEADNNISIWIDDIETQRLYGFLQTLLTDYDVGMVRASISSEADGFVSAQFTLSPN